MSANPERPGGLMDPDPRNELDHDHAPEPWRQEGRYIRDAHGGIVVRGRSAADARRIAAAINGVRGIPTVVLESWRVDDVSDPSTRPDFEVELSDPVRSPHEVRPPDSPASDEFAFPLSPPAFPLEKPYPYDRRVAQRRARERRERDRRAQP